MNQPATDPAVITIDGTAFHFIFADLLPPLSDDEYAALRSNIQQHGIKVAVNLTENADGSFNVTDGQHRLKIAHELGLALDAIPRKVEDLDPDTQETLALSLNLARRHLSPDQRQQLVLTLRQKGQSLRQIASAIDVSPATVLRDLSSPGVSNETPDTITGADGKTYDAQSPQTRTRALADKIMGFFTARDSELQVATVRGSITEQESGYLEHALNLLLAEYRITHVPGKRGFYAQVAPPTDEKIRDVVVATLAREGTLTDTRLASKVATALRAPVDVETLRTELRILQARDLVIELAANRWARVPGERTLDDVLEALEQGAADFQALTHRSHMSAATLAPALAHLERKGRVIKTGNVYALVAPDTREEQAEQPADAALRNAILEVLSDGNKRQFADLHTVVRKRLGLTSLGKRFTDAFDALEEEELVINTMDGYTLTDAGKQALAASATNDELRAHFNSDAVKIGTGKWDQGAWHRAIEIARKLRAAGLWDGQTPLTLNEVYALHDRIFGVTREPVTNLVAGVDYQIHDATDSAGDDAPVVIIDGEPLTMRQVQEIAGGVDSTDTPTEPAEAHEPFAGKSGKSIKEEIDGLPLRQREFLVSLARDEPVVKNAATRIALVNRKMIESYVGDGDWWDNIELTSKGRMIAATLLKMAAADSTDTRAEPAEAHEQGQPAHAKSQPEQPQRRVVTIETAREFIADQLKASTRPLTPGEIAKWANIDLEVTKAALTAMVEAGNLATVEDARGGLAYHYADVMRQKQAEQWLNRAINLADIIAGDLVRAQRLADADWSPLTAEQVERVRAAIRTMIGSLGHMIELLDNLDGDLAAQLAPTAESAEEPANV